MLKDGTLSKDDKEIVMIPVPFREDTGRTYVVVSDAAHAQERQGSEKARLTSMSSPLRNALLR
jgi:hypothetical protein